MKTRGSIKTMGGIKTIGSIKTKCGIHWSDIMLMEKVQLDTTRGTFQLPFYLYLQDLFINLLVDFFHQEGWGYGSVSWC